VAVIGIVMEDEVQEIDVGAVVDVEPMGLRLETVALIMPETVTTPPEFTEIEIPDTAAAGTVNRFVMRALIKVVFEPLVAKIVCTWLEVR